ncbi:hypothetical protein D030_5174A, partial [Vibrio parahaemolyticus AQ3810]
MQVAFQLSFLG